MTEDERYDMGWGSSSDGGGGGFGIGNGDSRAAASARRCCPVCKAKCTVREVVPIYVRESDDQEDDGTAAAASANDEMDGTDESASLSHPSSPSNERVAAAESADPTTSTGLRRRRGGAGGGGEFSALGGGNAEDFARNDDDNISISTISTEDEAHVASAASASDGANAVSSRPNRTAAAADIPSRPTAQPYLHQRSAAEDAPMTPLINNRQQRASTTVGIGRAPLSPPRGARPSSLSNGLSLSFWGGFVDALLGAQTNAAATGNGNGTGAGGGYVPPIHRPSNGRGPRRAASAVSGGNADDAAGQHGTEDGGLSAGAGANGSPPTETTGGGRWFSPAFVEDSTTEFLSRLLLMLGCFVVFCLLLF